MDKKKKKNIDGRSIKNNPTYKRTSYEIELDKELISTLIIQNKTLTEIHETIKNIRDYSLSMSMVHKIYHGIKKEWREATLESSISMIQQELKKSFQLEREAYIQYSLSDSKKSTIEKRKIPKGGELGENEFTTIEEREKIETPTTKDPVWLKIISDQMKYRQALLSLKLPQTTTTKQKYVVSVKKK